METLEAGDYSVVDCLALAKELRQRKEKDRARSLVNLLYETVVKKEDLAGQLTVLKDLARFDPLPKSKLEIRQVLEKIYPKDSSLTALLRHYRYEEVNNPDDLVERVKKMERWLSCDKGRIVYEPRYGIGRVRENSFNLGLVRVDFEQKKDVSLEFEDPDMTPLPEGHLFRLKLESPVLIAGEAEAEPGIFVGRVLEAFGRPLKAGELKEFMSAILPDGRWTSWWNSAKKHPQLLTLGKGASAAYSWRASASEAQEDLKAEFDRSDLVGKMEIAKQATQRKNPAAAYFDETLLAAARKAHQEKDAVTALQLIDFFSRSPALQQAAGYTLENIVSQGDPLELMQRLRKARLDSIKERVVAEIPTLFPDRWKSILLEAFLKEDSGRISTVLFQILEGEALSELDSALDKVVMQPHLYPAAFCWMCQAGSEEPTVEGPVHRRVDGRFLLSALRHFDEREFIPFRNRIKTALEKGLLLNVLNKPMEKEIAEKAVSLLDHTAGLEDYRRARFKGVILSRVPEAKKKEDVIFTTVEALDRKKKELDHLINVELPANRKAVGEAAAHGDLRENAEYKAARERQEYLIVRLEGLQRDIVKARLLDPAHIDCSQVRPGTRVALKQPSGKEMPVTILGLWDSNPSEGIYSYQTGIAIALLGKAPGESVEINGETWTIDSIVPWTQQA